MASTSCVTGYRLVVRYYPSTNQPRVEAGINCTLSVRMAILHVGRILTAMTCGERKFFPQKSRLKRLVAEPLAVRRDPGCIQ